MHSGALQKILKVGCLILTSLAFATVARAQLTLDLKASAGTTTDLGGNVTTWADSGSGISVSASGSAAPLLTTGTDALAGQTVLRFDGVDNIMSTSSGIFGSSLVSATESTMFFVMTPHSLAGQVGQAPIVWAGSAGVAISYTDLSGNLRYVQGDQGSGDFVQASLPSGWYDTTHLVTMVRNGNVGSIRVDGLTIADNVSFSGSVDTSASGTLFVGAANSGTGHEFYGDIAEIQIYKNGLNSTQIGNVESSLAGTYGLTLVPEPTQYATVFSVACLLVVVCLRSRRVLARA